MTKKGKLAIVQISQTRDIDIRTVTYKEDRAHIDGDEPQFDSNSIFRLKVLSSGPLHQIRNALKFRLPAVIWIEGKPFCERMITKEGDLLEPITNDDRKAVVRREIVKVLSGLKGLKNWMFGAIIAGIILVIILQLLLMGGVRF